MKLLENSFFEYLELQGGDSRLLTRSELLRKVKQAGFTLSTRQLTFYISENLVPQSVRAGSRAGVYPAIVADLMIWILMMRESGASIEALRELLPVWKFLVRSRGDHLLDIAELELVVRQHAESTEAQYAVPIVVTHVMHRTCCPNCHGRDEIMVVDKERVERRMIDPKTTIGFAIARPLDSGSGDDTDDDERGAGSNEWIGRARITLSGITSPNNDPTVVRMGRKANEVMPPDEGCVVETDAGLSRADEEVDTTS